MPEIPFRPNAPVNQGQPQLGVLGIYGSQAGVGQVAGDLVLDVAKLFAKADKQDEARNISAAHARWIENVSAMTEQLNGMEPGEARAQLKPLSEQALQGALQEVPEKHRKVVQEALAVRNAQLQAEETARLIGRSQSMVVENIESSMAQLEMKLPSMRVGDQQMALRALEAQVASLPPGPTRERAKGKLQLLAEGAAEEGAYQQMGAALQAQLETKDEVGRLQFIAEVARTGDPEMVAKLMPGLTQAHNRKTTLENAQERAEKERQAKVYDNWEYKIATTGVWAPPPGGLSVDLQVRAQGLRHQMARQDATERREARRSTEEMFKATTVYLKRNGTPEQLEETAQRLNEAVRLGAIDPLAAANIGADLQEAHTKARALQAEGLTPGQQQAIEAQNKAQATITAFNKRELGFDPKESQRAEAQARSMSSRAPAPLVTTALEGIVQGKLNLDNDAHRQVVAKWFHENGSLPEGAHAYVTDVSEAMVYDEAGKRLAFFGQLRESRSGKEMNLSPQEEAQLAVMMRQHALGGETWDKVRTDVRFHKPEPVKRTDLQISNLSVGVFQAARSWSHFNHMGAVTADPSASKSGTLLSPYRHLVDPQAIQAELPPEWFSQLREAEALAQRIVGTGPDREAQITTYVSTLMAQSWGFTKFAQGASYERFFTPRPFLGLGMPEGMMPKAAFVQHPFELEAAGHLRKFGGTPAQLIEDLIRDKIDPKLDYRGRGAIADALESGALEVEVSAPGTPATGPSYRIVQVSNQQTLEHIYGVRATLEKRAVRLGEEQKAKIDAVRAVEEKRARTEAAIERGNRLLEEEKKNAMPTPEEAEAARNEGRNAYLEGLIRMFGMDK